MVSEPVPRKFEVGLVVDFNLVINPTLCVGNLYFARNRQVFVLETINLVPWTFDPS